MIHCCLQSKGFCYISSFLANKALKQKKWLIFSSASVLMSSSLGNVLLLHLIVKKEHCPHVSDAIWVYIKILSLQFDLHHQEEYSSIASVQERYVWKWGEHLLCYTVFNATLHQTKSLIMPSVFFQRARCCFCCVDDTGKMLISTNTSFSILGHHLKI